MDRDLNNQDGAELISGIPVNIEIKGSPSIQSEIERSIETGYRLQSGQRWSLDTSIYWSYYSRLVAISFPQQPQILWDGPVPTFLMIGTEQNVGAGRSYGAETSATWQVTPTWRLLPGYSYLNESKWLPPNSAWLLNSSSPRHQGWLRSQHDLSRKWQVDLMARARSRNIPFDTPGVLLLDARLGWRPNRSTELSFSVQNLGGRTVLETYSESPFVAIPTQRTFVFGWTQKF
jgi:iron complex outermembrane receptor protein